MPAAVDEFWRRAIASRLISAARSEQLKAEFLHDRGAAAYGMRELARWLLSHGVLTREQILMLAGGKDTPPPPPAVTSAADSRLADDSEADELISIHARRAPARNGNRGFAVIVGVGLLTIATAVAASLMFADRRESEAPASPLAISSDPAVQGIDHSEPVPTTSAQRSDSEIDDDGQTLWAAPAAGAPLSLKYLPSGVQVLLVLRPAKLLASDEGQKAFRSLDPAGAEVKARLEGILGQDLSLIEQLSIALYIDDDDQQQLAYVMRLQQPAAREQLLKSWQSPTPRETGGKTFYQGAGWAYYLPSESNDRTIAVARSAAMQQIVKGDGAPLVSNSIETLLQTSDASRDFNLLVASVSLIADRADLLPREIARLRPLILQFLGDGPQAVLLSASVGDDLFLELRALPIGTASPRKLADGLRERLDKADEQLESYLAALTIEPYGRVVLGRFPRMVQLLGDYTRAGVDGRQAVLRAYLPRAAAHNLILGTRLVLAESATGGISPRADTTPRQLDPAAALDKSISISFPRDTLEGCLEMVAREVGVSIQILGPDLQAEGITKNKSFGLDMRNRSAKEVLQAALKLASPDEKLVYVLGPQANDQQGILVTTRSAAKRRGDKLPADFDTKSSKSRDKSS